MSAARFPEDFYEKVILVVQQHKSDVFADRLSIYRQSYLVIARVLATQRNASAPVTRDKPLVATKAISGLTSFLTVPVFFLSCSGYSHQEGPLRPLSRNAEFPG
ncbi:hypothetical protein V2I52_13380 [Brenneria sp. g21c3]|uniref:hypothetical protein n=1 Tax=Brenneria sp. g21c3 TaxID=3093893 RepID=UPI002EB2299B|nr:hypothetical protein [Brenneria sp. g21c3]